MKRVYRAVRGGRSTAAQEAQASGAELRVVRTRLTGANQEWAMDFIVDGLATGRMVRIHPQRGGCVHARVSCAGG